MTKEDAEVFWDLRLFALESAPTVRSANLPRSIATRRFESFARRLGLAPATTCFVFGAFDGPQLVGTNRFLSRASAKTSPQGLIAGVFVVAAYRRRGIARACIAAVLKEARALQGLRKVHLTVSLDQPAARKLYPSLGFRSYGVEPEALNAEGRYLDEELMFLDL